LNSHFSAKYELAACKEEYICLQNATWKKKDFLLFRRERIGSRVRYGASADQQNEEERKFSNSPDESIPFT